MASLETPVCEFGLPAFDFNLPDTNGKFWTLESCRGENGLLIMFICNHCPYVKAVIDHIVRDTDELQQFGICSAAIMSNDPQYNPEDSPDNMKHLAREKEFSFPYLFDGSQGVARQYGAICTPDFFGYNADLRLQYRGRLDECGIRPAAKEVRRELYEAMKRIAQTGLGPEHQIPSIGCSIKWSDRVSD